MKTKFTITVLLFLLAAMSSNAQAPQGFNYQAIVRSVYGEAIPNHIVTMRFTIIDSSVNGLPVYQETQTLTSNILGLVTAVIGNGTVVSGTFSSIKWGVNNKYLDVEMDINGGTNYQNMGTSQLESVPYALNAGNVSGTQYYVPVFTSNSTLGNSDIYDASGFVGIGATYSTIGGADQFRVNVPTITGGYYGGMSVTTTAADGKPFLSFGNVDNYIAWIYVDGSDSGKFKINNNGDAFAVNSAGLVGIGTTTPTYPLTLSGQYYQSLSPTGGSWNKEAAIINSISGANAGLVLTNGSGTSGGAIFGSAGGGINVADQTLAYAAVNASAFNVTSDITAKKDVQYLGTGDFTACLKQIRDIKSIRFRYNTESETQQAGFSYRPVLHLGVVAQTLPAELVANIDNSPDGSSNKGTHLGVSLADMNGLLVAGVKALDVKQDEMQRTINQQQQLIKNLQAEIDKLKSERK